MVRPVRFARAGLLGNLITTLVLIVFLCLLVATALDGPAMELFAGLFVMALPVGAVALLAYLLIRVVAGWGQTAQPVTAYERELDQLIGRARVMEQLETPTLREQPPR